jgi:hypothetical protein
LDALQPQVEAEQEKRKGAEENLRNMKAEREATALELEAEQEKRKGAEDNLRDMEANHRDANEIQVQRVEKEVRTLKAALYDLRWQIRTAREKTASETLQFTTVSENNTLKNERKETLKEVKTFRDEALEALSDKTIEPSVFSKAVATMYKHQLTMDKQCNAMFKIIEMQKTFIIDNVGPACMLQADFPDSPPDVGGFDENGERLRHHVMSRQQFERAKKRMFLDIGVQEPELYDTIAGSQFKGDEVIKDTKSKPVYLISSPTELTLCRNLRPALYDDAVHGTLDGGKKVELGGVSTDFYQPYRRAFPILEDFESLLAKAEPTADIDIETAQTSGSIEVFLRDGEHAYTACPLFISLPEKSNSIGGMPETITPSAFATKLLRANIELDAECQHALVCCWAVATAQTPLVSINDVDLLLYDSDEDFDDGVIHDETSATAENEASSQKRSCVDQMPAARIVKRSRSQMDDEFTRFIFSENKSVKTNCVVCGDSISGASIFESQSQLEKIVSRVEGRTPSNTKKKNNNWTQLHTHSSAKGCKLWCIFGHQVSPKSGWTTVAYAFYQLSRSVLQSKPLTFETVVRRELLLNTINDRTQRAMILLRKHVHSAHKNLWTGDKMDNASSRIKGKKGDPFPKTKLITFLEKSETHIKNAQEKLNGYIQHRQFDMLVTKNFTKEKFINNLNMAMSCYTEFKTFCSELESMLS